MSSPVYGVRSRPLGQTSYYQGPFELKAGDYVLVAAEQGSALGRVVSGPAELPEGRSDEDLPQILRQASPEDICRGRRMTVWPLKPRPFAAAVSVNAAWI